jgi:hypothetical protein
LNTVWNKEYLKLKPIQTAYYKRSIIDEEIHRACKSYDAEIIKPVGSLHYNKCLLKK